MNQIFIKGRLTRNPEYKPTQTGIDRTNFDVAVDRRNKDANGNRQTDFFRCVAWRQTAKFVSDYFTKGQEIIVIGSVQNRTYDAQDGSKRSVSEVVVDAVEFCGKRGETAEKPSEPDKSEFIPVDDDSELPF